MATEAEHIAKANRDQETLSQLLASINSCSEWAVVVAFYKSLHVLEAIFSRDPAIRHASSHTQRLDYLKYKRKYTLLFKPYHALWTASLIARYLEHANPKTTYSTFSDYLPAAEVQSKLLDISLVAFESNAVQLLSDPDSLVRYTPSVAPAVKSGRKRGDVA